MKEFKKILLDFAVTFAATLVATAVVTFTYSLLAHGTSGMDWQTSLRFAIVFGLVIPWARARVRRRKKNAEKKGTKIC